MIWRLRVLTKAGLKVIDVSSEADASRVGAHWNAIRQFLNSGDDFPLWDFDNDAIEGDVFETDLDAIEAWSRSGELDFDEIYED
jgi:hypothetical protein